MEGEGGILGEGEVSLSSLWSFGATDWRDNRKGKWWRFIRWSVVFFFWLFVPDYYFIRERFVYASSQEIRFEGRTEAFGGAWCSAGTALAVGRLFFYHFYSA